MKESDFIKQNNQKWDELESSFINETKDPRQKSRLFTKITDDLSYARTFYRNRSVREYLNGTAQILFSDLNLNERFSFVRFIKFFTDTFPKAMYATRRSMLISLIVFVLSFIIGAYTAKTDPAFASEILGSGYVAMTEKNIANDDPMAVYKDSGEFEMFWYIAFNNLRVCAITFLFGILTSIGSLLIMIQNGVMVGVFQYFFIQKGLFWPSFLTIWTHGTIEIACIIVAGGAGIQLGKGMLFPGTYSRVEAFKMSAQSALVVIAGIAPLVAIAAFIESFQTRHTEIDDLLRLGFILFCLAFVVFYFFWYPRTKYSNQKNALAEFEKQPVKSSRETFNPSEILSTFKVFSFTVGHLLKFPTRTFPFLLAISFAYGIMIVFTPGNLFIDPILFETGRFVLGDMFSYDDFIFMSIPVILCISVVLLSSSLFFKSNYGDKSPTDKTQVFKLAFASLFFTTLICITLGLKTVLGTILMLVIAPLFCQILAIISNEGQSLLNGPRLILPYLKANWGKFLLLNLLFYLMSACLFLVCFNLVLPLIDNALTMFVTDSIIMAQKLSLALRVGFLALIPFSLFYLFSIGSNFLFFTLKETNTANHLFTRIKWLLIE